MWDTKPDAFIVAATLPPELAYWVGHWARNPTGVPKPIREDEFGHLDLGDLDIWLWSRTVAPETYKGKFIAALWDIFLTIGRWVELAGDDRWALPTTNNLHNNILAQWVWEDGSTPDNVKPQRLARWLGQKVGVMPNRARNLLKLYARHRKHNMYFSHMAQEAHNESRAKQARKTILVTMGTMAVEHSSTAPPMSGSLAARLSDVPVSVDAGLAVHDSTMDTKQLAAPLVPPASTSTPMDVDKAAALPSSRDIGTDTSAIYFNKTP